MCFFVNLVWQVWQSWTSLRKSISDSIKGKETRIKRIGECTEVSSLKQVFFLFVRSQDKCKRTRQDLLGSSFLNQFHCGWETQGKQVERMFSLNLKLGEAPGPWRKIFNGGLPPPPFTNAHPIYNQNLRFFLIPFINWPCNQYPC